jgi:hypothetical protein
MGRRNNFLELKLTIKPNIMKMSKRMKLYCLLLIIYALIINVAYVMIDPNGLPIISQIIFGFLFHSGFQTIFEKYTKNTES